MFRIYFLQQINILNILNFSSIFHINIKLFFCTKLLIVLSLFVYFILVIIFCTWLTISYDRQQLQSLFFTFVRTIGFLTGITRHTGILLNIFKHSRRPINYFLFTSYSKCINQLNNHACK